MSESERQFESLGGQTVHRGRIIKVRVERFRYADGHETERDIVHHPGAVGIVAVDHDHIWLVRQPREAVGDPDQLEIPAGLLDQEGEPPLETAKRELAEEIGQAAERWEHLTTYRSSVGFTDEQVHVYLAEGLRDQAPENATPEERIEIVRHPRADLDGLIARVTDAKTLIGLLLLRARGG